MPELRRDLITGRWVVLAPGRAARPEVKRRGGETAAGTPQSECPFCPGNESRTPPEVEAVRSAGGEADSPGWSVRVVPNLFPAFAPEEATAVIGDPLHQLRPALGTCEVIIHSPDHRRWLPYLSAEQARVIMVTTQRRYVHNAGAGTSSVVVLYNHGASAGASLEHPHGQLYATHIAAPHIEEEVEGAKRAFAEVNRCAFCHMIEVEEAAGTRVIAADNNFLAVAPWASRGPYECWIIPREHAADFGLVSETGAGELGIFLRAVLWRLSQELGDPDLNWYLHSLPNPAPESAAAYHWHIEIRPRLIDIAGFEMATGTYINTVAPEEVAAALRDESAPGLEEQEPPVRA